MTNGVAMPSFSPLSTLSRRRIRLGIRVSSMMVAPRAASVGATMAPMAAATHSEMPGMRPKATAVPSPMASGSPTASSRTGRPRSWRSSCTLTRDASVNRTSARVTSASERMVEECGLKWMKARGPCVITRPMTTNAMGAVTYSRSSRAATSDHRMMHPAAAPSTAVSRPWLTGAVRRSSGHSASTP